MSHTNNTSAIQHYLGYQYISLDSTEYGENSYRVELVLERPRRPFSKDQRNRIHSRLGIPSKWTWKFTWDGLIDRKMINGLTINGDAKNFSESVDNVVSEIIHCIAVGRITYDSEFNQIHPYIQKQIVGKIMHAIKHKRTTLQATTIFDESGISKISHFVWVKDMPLEQREITLLEEFVGQCQGNQKDEIIKKLKLFAAVPNYLDEINSEIKSIKNSVFGKTDDLGTKSS